MIFTLREGGRFDVPPSSPARWGSSHQGTAAVTAVAATRLRCFKSTVPG